MTCDDVKCWISSGFDPDPCPTPRRGHECAAQWVRQDRKQPRRSDLCYPTTPRRSPKSEGPFSTLETVRGGSDANLSGPPAAPPTSQNAPRDGPRTARESGPRRGHDAWPDGVPRRARRQEEDEANIE
ncbi:hypothetical protein HPB47_007459, partial [Ixodes persulcatus]